jgi:hypothetical protein
MHKEGAFTRLVDLIASPKSDAEPGLHRLFMELLYEMSRIQRVKIDDLSKSKSSVPSRAQTRRGTPARAATDPSTLQSTSMTLSYDISFRL